MPTVNEMLTTISANYIPTHPLHLQILRDKPLFNLRFVPEMLYDSRITFGLNLLKGPILANSQFFVNVEDAPPEIQDELKKFLIKNITRFWRNSASRSLEAIDYGYAGHEVLYKVEDNKLQFDILKGFNALDIKPVTVSGKIIGLIITKGVEGQEGPLFIGGAKAFWHVHWRQFNPWFGRSRLFSAFVPWIEKWTDGGFRDLRRLFWHKFALDGGTLYHPPGDTRLEDGGTMANKDIARRIMEAAKSGGTRTFPNTTKDGQRAWDHIPPAPGNPPAGMEEYGSDLNDEMLEALGIPPEVARAVGTGAFAGRRIPQQAFFSILTELVIMLMSDADQQIFRNLVEFNFGPKIPYEIVPFGLLKRPGQTGQPDQPEPESEEGLEMSIPIHTLAIPNQGIIAA